MNVPVPTSSSPGSSSSYATFSLTAAHVFQVSDPDAPPLTDKLLLAFQGPLSEFAYSSLQLATSGVQVVRVGGEA